MKTDLAVKAIIKQDDKILIIKQKVEGEIFYSIPGGRVEGGGIKNELLREVQEETGLKVQIKDYVGDFSFTRANGDITECRVYICTLIGELELSPNESEDYEEIQDYLWLTYKQISSDEFTINPDLKKLILKTEDI